MKNLAMSRIMAGANVWDAPGHSMAGSNDINTRKEIFHWIARNEKIFYSLRSPIHPVGVYFSPKSRDYDAAGFLPSYRGTLLLLLQKHRELQVVTPRTLAEFRGPVLVLPNVSILDAQEKSQLKQFMSKRGRLVITGKDATDLNSPTGVERFTNCPAKAYLTSMEKDFATGSQSDPKEFVASMDTRADLSVEAAPSVAANIASVNGQVHVFVANFSGLVPRKIAVPTVQKDVKISMSAGKDRTLRVLPFLGEVHTVHGQCVGDRLVFTLPAFERGICRVD
jgi:hypothetical protein